MFQYVNHQVTMVNSFTTAIQNLYKCFVNYNVISEYYFENEDSKLLFECFEKGMRF